MAKPFDASLRFLLTTDPASWLAFASLPADGPATAVDSNLSTISAEADAAVRIDGPMPWLAHFEFQASRDATLGLRLLRYNVLLGYRDEVPVRSVVVLLRPEADGPELTGTYRVAAPDGSPIHEFRYDVVRVWEKPMEEVLRGGLGTLAMAPLAAVDPGDLPGLIRRMGERIGREAPAAEAGELWTATNVLMGLRYSTHLTEHLLSGVRAMEESVTYQAIVAKGEAKGLDRGRLDEARRILLRQGRRRFGEPSEATVAAIEALDDLDRVEALLDRVFELSGWGDLLASP